MTTFSGALQSSAASTACAIILVAVFHASSSRSSFQLSSLIFLVILTVASTVWLNFVSDIVLLPYLDEIFHIPQAQKYCQGRYREWDGKITTPPGLYLLSVSLPEITKRLGFPEWFSCDAKSLRATNVVGIVVLSYLALCCRHALEQNLSRIKQATSASAPRFSYYASHTAFNIALFPLLFFFSGLYYTDVVSTAVVLLAFLNHLGRISRASSSILNDLNTILLGAFSLLMRQTNVFWIVIFMGGVEAVHAIKMLRPKQVDRPTLVTLAEHLKYFSWRYSLGDIHDISVDRAYPDDMLFTTLSLAVAALCNPIRILRQVWPYIIVLLGFSGFVAWNGSVVLGDKSNHVATLHLAQMLYIWPFFAFFSLPLILPSALRLVEGAVMLSTGEFKIFGATAKTTPKKSVVLGWTFMFFESKIPWMIYLVATIVVSVIVVKFNTIIHPFTLADNRHYMFYIFRYTIRRSLLIRLLLIIPYTAARWMVWDTLCGCKSWIVASISDVEDQPLTSSNHPFQTLVKVHSAKDHQPKSGKKSSGQSVSKSADVIPTSTGLIFLVATSLSLITAPLVEPRYFIIPWVIWRLMTPAWTVPTDGIINRVPEVQAMTNLLQGYDPRLFLETAWFSVIHLVTAYIFLYKPYIWRAEDGSVLDNGQLQRFMW